MNPDHIALTAKLAKASALSIQAKVHLDSLEDEVQTLAAMYNLDGKLTSFLSEHFTEIRTRLETLAQIEKE